MTTYAPLTGGVLLAQIGQKNASFYNSATAVNGGSMIETFRECVEVAKAEVKAQDVMSDGWFEALEKLKALVHDEVKRQLDAGQAVVFETSSKNYYVVSRSATGDEAYQVDRTTADGRRHETAHYDDIGLMVQEFGFHLDTFILTPRAAVKGKAGIDFDTDAKRDAVDLHVPM